MVIDYNEIWQSKWGDMQKYGPVHKHNRRLMLKILEDLEFNSLLDIGCGNGINLLSIAKSKGNLKTICGIDISEKALIAAKVNLSQAVFYNNIDIQKEKLNAPKEKLSVS